MKGLQLGDRNNGVSDLRPAINKSRFQAVRCKQVFYESAHADTRPAVYFSFHFEPGRKVRKIKQQQEMTALSHVVYTPTALVYSSLRFRGVK